MLSSLLQPYLIGSEWLFSPLAPVQKGSIILQPLPGLSGSDMLPESPNLPPGSPPLPRLSATERGRARATISFGFGATRGMLPEHKGPKALSKMRGFTPPGSRQQDTRTSRCRLPHAWLSTPPVTKATALPCICTRKVGTHTFSISMVTGSDLVRPRVPLSSLKLSFSKSSE